MKIHLANYDPTRIGGGWTFSNYIAEHVGLYTYGEADTYLIAGASLATHEQVEQAKRDGKKVVLRVDNHLLPSRNRNTGMSRLQAFAKLSDILIYQSKWAHDYLSPILGKGEVILNGVDTNVFKKSEQRNSHCLYVRSSRINEKGWEMSRYWFSNNFRDKDLGQLNIIGKFSKENLEYNFDFYNGEPYRFYGEQPGEIVAQIMQNSRYFLYSYFMDACSNTLLEARASGCEIVDVYGMLQTGGAPEIMACEDISLDRMIKEYTEVMEGL